MQAANIARRAPNRKSHYDRPLVDRPSKTRFAFLVRGMEYVDEETARHSMSALPDDELVPQLWKHAPRAMVEALEFPEEALVEPYPLYARAVMEVLVIMTYDKVRASVPEWSDRDRVVRTIVAAQMARNALGTAKAIALLNEGDRAKNGLTRYSIQSVWKTFRAALKEKRWDLGQLTIDTMDVKALLYLEEKARDDNRFRSLKGEDLADAIEQHVGMAEAMDRAYRILFPQLVLTGGQKSDD